MKRWRGGTMILRWVAAGVGEAEKRFRRLKGYRDTSTLIAALDNHDRKNRESKSAIDVQENAA
ncbi:MAG TPA: hypothetical protein DEF51_14545 [Myxococcales bacterium]|nr:hypothetical protein [Myxococcales bacterium]